MSCVRVGSRIGLFLLLGLFPKPLFLVTMAHADEGERFELPISVTAAALNPQTGDVVIASATGNQVWLLPAACFQDRSFKPVGPLVKVPNPIHVGFKQFQDQSYIMIGCFGPDALIVLNADTHTALRMPTNVGAITSLTSTDDSQDPRIFASCIVGSRQLIKLFRIDSSSNVAMTLEQLELGPHSADSSAVSIAVSSTGRWLYVCDEFLHKFRCWRIQEPNNSGVLPTFSLFTERTSRDWKEPIRRLSHEQGVIQGTSLWTADLGESPKPLLFRAESGDFSRPVICGTANRDLRLASLRTGAMLARFQLPPEFVPLNQKTISLGVGTQTFRQTLKPVVLVDGARDRVIVLADRAGMVFDIADVPFPDEPVLAATVDIPRTVIVGEKLMIDIKPGDPRIEVRLRKGPPGMLLENNKLEWTATAEQIGSVTLELQYAHGEATTTEEFHLAVAGRATLCPFVPDGSQFDSSGTHLLIWKSGEKSQIGWLDLEKGNAKATRELPHRIIDVSLVVETLAVLTSDEKRATVSLLDPKTLETRIESTIEAESNVRYLDNAFFSVADNTVSLHAQSGRTYSYLLPHLKRIPDDELPTDSIQRPTNADGFICHALIPKLHQKGPAPPQRSLSIRDSRFPLKLKINSTSVNCIDFPVRLNVDYNAEAIPGRLRVDLVARKSNQDVELYRWPIDVIDPIRGSNVAVSLSVSGSRAALTIDANAYAQDLSSLSELNLQRPLDLHIEQNSLLEIVEGTTRLNYSITGGVPPYVVEFRLLTSNGIPPRAAKSEKVPGTSVHFDADIATYVKDQMPSIAQTLTLWSKDTAAPDILMNAYANSVATRFEQMTGRTPKGVVVAIPVAIDFQDTENPQRHILHYLLVDIPKEELELELNLAIAKRWPGTVVAKDAEARVIAIRGLPIAPELIQLSKALLVEHSKTSKTSNTTISPEELETAAQAALMKCEERWQATLKAERNKPVVYPFRQWVDTDGNTLNARYVKSFAGQIIIMLDLGDSVAIASEKLSVADLKYVDDLTAPRDPEIAARELSRLYLATQLRQIAEASRSFHNSHRLYPPNSLLIEDKQEGLSWRVLILPFLGGNELYELFRLNEPWYSAHNTTIAQFMPSVFRVAGVETEPSHTAILRIVGQQTGSPPNFAIRSHDIRDGISDTLFAVVAAGNQAVDWTCPRDLILEDEISFSSRLWWQDEKATVLMFNTAVKSVSSKTTSDAWLQAAGRNDGKPANLQVE